MRKKQPRAKRRTVADILRSRERSLPEFTPEQAQQVRIALASNDRASGANASRLSSREVMKLLRDEYDFAHGEVIFERMVCARFKRRSWVSK